MKKIAIFASGNGSNAEAIIKYFKKKSKIGQVSALLSNKSDAYALQRAKDSGVATYVFKSKEFLDNPSDVINYLEEQEIDLIVLAGYMQLIPKELIKVYRDKIVNIHPALLPKYGGKGMYGMNVHRAVIENKESESGITIHLIDEEYDKGAILFQTRVTIYSTDTAESLAEKVMALEHKHYAEVIEKLLVELE